MRTFTLPQLFFVINGSMNQLLEILCQLSDEKVCSYTFDTLHPEISQPLYYLLIFLMFIALGIISFTQVVSNLE
ncbi:hypothetical protein [Candidatus Coxiella mudrowiae]|uniref:hypothetical protein n=1 Tax=Candidatus Coxiella mudrowiae TaxID=2054173 RepID=UPI00066278F5|nr:hypothetical protein [Candidatus Coxiella mudrowiae]